MTAWLAQQPFPDVAWLGRNAGEIARRLVEHVELTVLAVVIGFAVAFPLAVAAVRWRRLYPPLLQATAVMFTIPSLALIVGLVPFTGLSRTTALIPLVMYTLLILLRNIVTGLVGVPAEVLEAATAMGYRRPQRLRHVELPLALPVVIAGVRIATVTTIGLVTVTAVIGHGGLGQIILVGFNRSNSTASLVGFGLCVALALLADTGLVWLQRRLTPWAAAREG